MDSMDRFVAATKPVLEKMLKGTCVKATYRRTVLGGEVRLRLDLHSVLSFDEDHIGEHFEEEKADEVRNLVEGHLEMIGDAAVGESTFARAEPDIELAQKAIAERAGG